MPLVAPATGAATADTYGKTVKGIWNKAGVIAPLFSAVGLSHLLLTAEPCQQEPVEQALELTGCGSLQQAEVQQLVKQG